VAASGGFDFVLAEAALDGLERYADPGLFFEAF